MKGVAILSLFNLQYNSIYIYNRRYLLNSFDLSEKQLHYFVALHGNDFIKHESSKNETIDFDMILRRISKNCKTEEDYKADFRNQWNEEMTNELETSLAIYNKEQVEFEYSKLTLDLSKVDEVKNILRGLMLFCFLTSR